MLPSKGSVDLDGTIELRFARQSESLSPLTVKFISEENLFMLSEKYTLRRGYSIHSFESVTLTHLIKLNVTMA